MYIALDLGGTNLRISSYGSLKDTTPIDKRVLSAQECQNYNESLQKIVQTIKELSGGTKIDGIGVSFSGEINPLTETILGSDAYREWEGHTFSKDLGKEFSCKSAIENDAVCAGLAEKLQGVAKEEKSMGFVIVGTGVGGVRIHTQGNSLYIYPTEFGHIPIVADGEKCICGQRGCIEAYASGKGIKAFYNTDAEHLDDEEAWIMLSRHMTQAIMNFMVMDRVDTFVFGGGLAINQKDFLQKLTKNVEHLLMTKISYEIPTFVISQFLDDAGSIGALGLLRDDQTLFDMKFQ